MGWGANGAIAQLVPDASLGAESSQVNLGGLVVNGQVSDRISGGAQRNGLLFHSFDRFNIGNGQGVYFANPTGVNTIITRVTGGSAANILGTLGVLGNANLFLLNPNGITFGPNARLALNGSFTASTAQAMVFDNGFVFSATNPQAPPLLTIRTPMGLQWGANPGAIINQSRATNATGTVTGLQVNDGQTLSLLGGSLQFPGGVLTAAGGAIELGSVAANSSVALVPQSTPTGATWIPSYAAGTQFQDIQLSQQALVDASGVGGGRMHIAGRNLSLTTGAAIAADTQGNLAGQGIAIDATQVSLDQGAFISASTFGAGRGGDLTIRASQGISVIGEGFDRYQTLYVVGSLLGTLLPTFRENGIFAQATGSGSGGTVTLSTNTLMLQAGGSVLGYAFASGNGANLVANVTDMRLMGGTVVMSALVGSSGNSGTVLVNTNRLTIEDGGFLVSGTNGAGNGGNMVINAADEVLVQRTPDGAFFSSSMGTVTLAGARGRGGDLEINTRRLVVQGGSAIGTSSGVTSRVGQPTFIGGAAGNFTINATESVTVSGLSNDGFYKSRLISETYNNSPGGEFTINTPNLRVADGGEISVAAYSSGPGGRLVINAPNAVTVTGTAADGRQSALLASSGGPGYLTASGMGGNLQLTTGQLTVSDGATVAVNSFGSGDAGTLAIAANTIQLNNRGSLIASTASGTGGNITLAVRDVLQLRRNSLISAEAGGTGNGGNIAIAAGFIAASSRENSDIIANAVQGRGGNITLNARGIFGLRFRPFLTPLSDINASSQFGVNGIVRLNAPNIDPSRGTTELPSQFVDPARLIASTCAARRAQQTPGSFAISDSGRTQRAPDDWGNVPFDTYRFLPDATLTGAVEPGAGSRASSQETAGQEATGSAARDRPPEPAIAEIDSIYQLPHGEIVLTRSCGGSDTSHR